jgi:hypothetical protein
MRIMTLGKFGNLPLARNVRTEKLPEKYQTLHLAFSFLRYTVVTPVVVTGLPLCFAVYLESDGVRWANSFTL